jgi:hypothetical protein
MKRAYQIDQRKALDRFHSHLKTNPGSLQLMLPLADLAQRLRHGVSQMLFDAEGDLLMLITNDEIQWLTRRPGMARWGTAPGSVIIHGQKAPGERPGFVTRPGKSSWAAMSCSGGRGDAAPVVRGHQHKQRNVCEHFAPEEQAH